MGHSIDTDTAYVLPEIFEGIINGYMLGMSEFEIVDVYDIDHKLVVSILDKYTRYL